MGFINSFLYGRNAFRYQVIPVVFLIFFTISIQVLDIHALQKPISLSLALQNLKGNATAWLLFLGLTVWAYASIKLSSKIWYGPETEFNYRPAYANNGFLYWCVSVGTLLALQVIYPRTCLIIYENYPEFCGVANSVAFVFCIVLYLKGKYKKDHKGDVPEPAPIPYEFYRGMELHPRILGVDVKQFSNCRFGMMSWQLLVIALFFASYQVKGFNMGIFMHMLLQTIYIAKFYWWEEGYFSTIDMMTDRAGYYMCWGCLAFIPGCFCSPAALVVNEPPTLSSNYAFVIGAIGIILSGIQYLVDREKHEFRKAWANKKEYKICGKPATFILAEYKDIKGQAKKIPLLTSGFWGIVRHMNYSFELIICLCVSATLGFDHGLYTYVYFIIIAGILIQRIVRDDDKCFKKYGKDWLRYKEKVKYVLIPGIY